MGDSARHLYDSCHHFRLHTEGDLTSIYLLLLPFSPLLNLSFYLQALEIIYRSSLHLVVLLYVATFISLIALGQLVSVFVNKAKFAGMLGFLTVVIFCAVGVSFIDDLYLYLYR